MPGKNTRLMVRYAMTNDLPHLKNGISELEFRLHLAPM
ncbi:hypothetical protein BH10CYA1_BH10CYA1_42860 [soil metagenome]